MKKKMLGALVATAVVFGGGIAVASDPAPGGPASGAAVRKFQKDTFALRDELAAKRADLQDEYQKPQPDRARVAALEKDIVDLQARIQAVAQRNGYRSWGPGYGRGMGQGMGMGYGMMYGGGPGSCGCW